MRKTVLDSTAAAPALQPGEHWLDLPSLARVEVTSEDPAFPIENAFLATEPGWRAAHPGEQRIVLLFDQPLALHRVQLHFNESQHERTQEFVLRYSPAPGTPLTDLRRQQWTFSPSGSTTEQEDYTLNLPAVSTLELAIRPTLHPSDALATLTAFRVA